MRVKYVCVPFSPLFVHGEKKTEVLFALYFFPLVGTLADSGFLKNFLYQGGVKSTVSWVFEDLKFKISEGSDHN